MARLILNNKEYTLFDFDLEDDLEKAVIENQQVLFGKDAVYIDVKNLIGKSRHRGIPDAFLIDFYDPQNPQLYIVENELASHSVYSHITEQIARFSTSIITSQVQIRDILIDAVKKNKKVEKLIENQLIKTNFKTLTELMLYLTENQIKIVVAINEITEDLNDSFKIFNNPPDVVLLQRYKSGNEILYYYEPMREEIDDIEVQKEKSGKAVDFDTVVCAAFEEGFKHAYVKNNAWWSIRLSQQAREKLKYLAIYEKSPVAHISHYAEIYRIEPYKDSGKYILHLKKKKTIKPIKLGRGKKGEAPQAPRYTTLEKLLKSKSVYELWN
jgi:hypothetical protein